MVLRRLEQRRRRSRSSASSRSRRSLRDGSVRLSKQLRRSGGGGMWFRCGCSTRNPIPILIPTPTRHLIAAAAADARYQKGLDGCHGQP